MSLVVTLHFESTLDALHFYQLTCIAVGQLNVQEYGEGGEPTVPQYVETLNKSLRKIFSDVKEQLASAHDRSKKQYDKGVSGEKFTVGDQVWLFVPAVKQRRTKKLASLWRGPYTVIDRINGALNYASS